MSQYQYITTSMSNEYENIRIRLREEQHEEVLDLITYLRGRGKNTRNLENRL